MDSVKDQLFASADWQVVSAGDAFPTGAFGGGLAGGGSGYVTDRIKKKDRCKKESEPRND